MCSRRVASQWMLGSGLARLPRRQAIAAVTGVPEQIVLPSTSNLLGTRNREVVLGQVLSL